MRISDWSSDVCSSDILGDELRLHRIIDVLRDSPIADPGDQFADYREWRKKPLAWLNSLAESVSGGEIETGRTEPPVDQPFQFGSVDRKSTRLNSSHQCASSIPASACKQNTKK